MLDTSSLSRTSSRAAGTASPRIQIPEVSHNLEADFNEREGNQKIRDGIVGEGGIWKVLLPFHGHVRCAVDESILVF